MRPPQKAGGNRPSSASRSGWSLCFNEAPAKSGGESAENFRRDRGFGPASMRPPQKAGGNAAQRRGGVLAEVASMRPPQKAGGIHG